MKFSMTGQEKGDLFIHVTAYYRQPHGQVLLYSGSFYDIINQPVSGFTAYNSTGNLTLRWTPANVNTERIR
jgi:hypothetical protein